MGRLQEAVGAAAAGLDERGLASALEVAFASFPRECALHCVVEPAIATLGEDASRGVVPAASRHLATRIVARRLETMIEPSSRKRGSVALCACWPGERQTLEALVVGLHLAWSGWRTLYLGAGLPFADLSRACDVHVPRLVFVSLTAPERLEPQWGAFLALTKGHPGTLFVLGGRGASAAVQRPRDGGGRLHVVAGDDLLPRELHEALASAREQALAP